MFSSGSQTEFIVDSEECAQGQRHGSKPGISLQFDGHWDPSPASALTGQLGKRTCFILKECQPVLNTFCYGQSKIVANASVTLFYVHLVRQLDTIGYVHVSTFSVVLPFLHWA